MNTESEGLSGRGLFWSRVCSGRLDTEPTEDTSTGTAAALPGGTVATGATGSDVERSGSFRPSPMETERDILAMELAVGLMYERPTDEEECFRGNVEVSC